MGKTIRKTISALMALIMIVSLTPAIAAETPESEISPEAFEEKMESDAQKARDNRSRILKNAEETIEKLKTAEKESGKKDDPGTELMSENSFALASNIKYISNAEELMAIDGEDNGVYVLRNDISLAGINWQPLNLTNAAIYGEGHTISGLTINCDVSAGFSITFIGLIGGNANTPFDIKSFQGNVVHDLTISNVNIRVSGHDWGYINITPVGKASMDNCDITGGMNVTVSGSDGGLVSRIYGISYGINCGFHGKLTVSSSTDGTYVSGINNGVNCSFTGDCKLQGKGTVIGIESGSFCTYNGDVSAKSAEGNNLIIGIGEQYSWRSIIAQNCYFNGNVSGDGECIGIGEAKDCSFSGSVSSMSKNGRASGIYDSEDCYLNGNIEAMKEDGSAQGIAWSDNCHIVGNTNGNYASGVSGSECSMRGNVNSTGRGAEGVSGENSCLTGNITCRRNEPQSVVYLEVSGVDGTNCFMYGNITITSTDEARLSIYGAWGEGSVLQGNVSFKGIFFDASVYGATEGQLIGNIDFTSPSGDSDAYIIGCSGENSKMSGSINVHVNKINEAYAMFPRVTGIENGDNSYFNGNITVVCSGDGYTKYGKEYVIIKCIAADGCSNSVFNGNISLTGTGNSVAKATGMNGCNNCSMYGSITTSQVRDYINIYGGTVIPTIDAVFGCSGCQFYGSAQLSEPFGTLSASGNHTAGFCLFRTHLHDTEYSEPCNACILDGKKHGHKEDSGDFEYNYPAQYGTISTVDNSTDPKPDDSPAPPDYPKPSERPDATYIMQFVDEMSGKPVSGASVSVDGKSYTADSLGMVTVVGKDIIGDISVYLGDETIFHSSNYGVVPNKLNIVKVGGLKIGKDDFSMGDSVQTELLGPEINIMGKSFHIFNLPFGFDTDDMFDSVKVAYNKYEKTYEILIGDADALGESTEEGQSEDASNPTWREKYDKVREVCETVQEVTDSSKELFELLESDDIFSPNKAKFGFDASVSTVGYLSIGLTENGLAVKDGGFIVAAQAEASGAKPLPPAPYIFISYGVTGSIEAGASFEFKKALYADPKLDISADVTMEVVPSVGIGAGLKKLVSAEVGLEGILEAKTKFPMKKLEDNTTVNLSAQLYFLLNLLCFEHKAAYTFTGAQLYPYIAPMSLMSVQDVNDLTLIGREDNDEISLAVNDDDTVKPSVYPYSSVQTAKLKDGREIMVWIDDDKSRNLVNKTALYYSITENGIMSAPQQIDNDGTADFDFEISSNGEKVAIVWQNSNSVLEESAGIDDVTAAIDISYAEFADGEWSEPIALTSENSDYEYNVSVGCRNPQQGSTKVVAAWVTNSNNNPIPGTGDEKENVYKVTVTDGVPADSASTVLTDMNTIIELTADRLGNIYTIVDKDGDTATPESVLYMNKSIIRDNDSVLSSFNTYTDFEYGDNFEGMIENGKYVSVDSDTVFDMIDNEHNATVIKCLPDEDMYNGICVYEVQDGFKSELYATYAASGCDAVTVKLTDFGGKIRSWDVQRGDDGEISVAAVVADVDVSGDSVSSNTARLVHTNTKFLEDVAVVRAYSEMSASAGKEIPISIEVQNNTFESLSDAKVKITGEYSGVIYEGTADTILNGGETGVLSVNVLLPADFTKQKITAEVTSETANDSNSANNSAEIVIGQANITAEIEDVSTGEDGGEAVIVIRNDGAEQAGNVTFTLTGENGEAIYSENAGTLEAGEIKKYYAPIDKKYYTFESSYDSFAIKVDAVSDTEEWSTYDNSDIYEIGSETVQLVTTEISELTLRPGETYKPEIQLYPPTADYADLYAVSSDETVASVSEDGTITAIGNGTALVSYMMPGVIHSGTIKVYVHELETPVISDLEYSNGSVSANVDVSNCVTEGENAVVIVAAYSDDGRLLGTNIYDAQENLSYNVSFYTKEIKPKYVKVMLWNSLSGAKPSSLAATAELTE